MSDRIVFMVSPSALTVNLGETFDPFLALNGDSFLLKNIAKGHNRTELRSYHNFLHKPCSNLNFINVNFKISTKHQHLDY